MMPRPACVLGFTLVASVSVPAAALAGTASACHVVDSLDRSVLTPAWRGAVDALEREISVSTCHGVELSLTHDCEAVRVTARAQDGRETSRHVATPAGLSAVAFGLLAVAPGEEIATPEDPLEVPPPPEPPSAPPAAALPSWELSFSASTGVRAAFPTDVLVADFDVRADLLVHSWLLTLRVRASPLVLAMRGTYDDDAYDEAAVGLGLGRQLRLGRSVLALTGESNVTYIWIESDALNLSMERAQLRLAAVARWGYPVGRGVRLHAAVEGEISPTGLVNGASEAGLAAFPAFTLGLCLGAEVVL